MAAYVLALVDVHTPDRYENYRREVPATLEPYQGRFLVRGGPREVLEGDLAPQRVVIIEFPDAARAREWYASAAYQAILPLRLENADSRLLVVEGV